MRKAAIPGQIGNTWRNQFHQSAPVNDTPLKTTAWEDPTPLVFVRIFFYFAS
jgi:hypothetical protein